MHFTAESISGGVSERLFTLGDVTGALWTPAGAQGSRPLVLLGHGGGQHKKAPRNLAHARRLVTACGFAAAAIDAPGHGDRQRTAQFEELLAGTRARIAAGEAAGPQMTSLNVALATWAIPDWQSVLDAVSELGLLAADGPVGYSGVSLGSGIGIPLTAAEPRITAAVFGLAAGTALAEAAARITVPVEFLLQWDDELVPRDAALALFGAFGSRQKTLHANPGGHADVPRFELDSAQLFFTRHLAAAPAAVAGR
jgi:alpha-beta hydrolase superfamily lysophospholipase